MRTYSPVQLFNGVETTKLGTQYNQVLREIIVLVYYQIFWNMLIRLKNMFGLRNFFHH